MAEAESKGARTGGRKRGRPVGRASVTTRDGIVRAARVVFGARGYAATTLTMIAREAGLSNTAVYYYFSSVEDIYGEVVADTVGLVEASLADVTTQRSLPVQLGAYVAAMHRLDFQDRSMMGFMIHEYLDAARGARLGRGKGPLMSSTERFLGSLVRAAVERGELAADTDVRAMIGLLSSIMWGVGLYAGFVDEEETMARVGVHLGAVLSRGLPLSGRPTRLVG